MFKSHFFNDFFPDDKSSNDTILNYKSSRKVYLDYNAMSVPRPEVIQLLPKIFGVYGNPFAAHSFGRDMKKMLEHFRDELAKILDCKSEEVIFTSGGTESNNLAILGCKSCVKGYIFGSTEHESVPAVMPSHLTVTVKMGEVDLNELESMLKENSPAFVSIMLVNNETGIITRNIREAANLTHQYGGIFHTDAVQAIGRMSISFEELGVDMMSISSLKSGGIIGSGALIKKKNIKCCQIMYGRTVEGGIRPGTQPVPLICAFVYSVMLANENLEKEVSHLSNLRNYLDFEILAAGGKVLGKDVNRSVNTSYIMMNDENMHGLCPDQSEQVMRFDMEGIAVSAGSACYKTRFFSEHFMNSVCVSESDYRSGVRVSMGYDTTKNNIDKFINVWKKLKLGQ